MMASRSHRKRAHLGLAALALLGVPGLPARAQEAATVPYCPPSPGAATEQAR